MLTEVPWILLHPIQDSTLEKEKKNTVRTCTRFSIQGTIIPLVFVMFVF
jgi:hypothetical protein